MSPGSSTHGVKEHCQEQFASVDDLVQLTGATRVFVVEDGVCEEATGLSGEDLGREKRVWSSRRRRSQGNEKATQPLLPDSKKGSQPLRGQDQLCYPLT